MSELNEEVPEKIAPDRTGRVMVRWVDPLKSVREVRNSSPKASTV